MKKYTKEQLLFYLKKLASNLSKTPTIKDINKSKECPSASTYVKRFGTWNKALVSAGLKINVKNQFNKEELIGNIRQLSKQLGKIPRPKDLQGKTWAASYATYRKHFGSWKNAIKEADITTVTTSSLKKFGKRNSSQKNK